MLSNRITSIRREGSEKFRAGGKDLEFDLLSFWQWMASDLVSNATRGILAEYIVARALGMGSNEVRDEWGTFDLLSPSKLKIEVKSCAYIQCWHQPKHSRIVFSARPTRAFDAISGLQDKTAAWQSDAFVFALLHHKIKETIKPLDLDQWEFFVVPTAQLKSRTRSQHSITLNSLNKLGIRAVGYESLREEIEKLRRS